MSDETPIDEFELKPPDDLKVRRCYRHPSRETGVSCANCDRPICHECMIPAAVGFWCPQCVAEQRQDKARAQVVTRSQTRARWQASGGALTVSGSPVTRALIVINVIMFLLEVVLGGGGVLGGAATYRVEHTLIRLGALRPYDVVVLHQYWRLGAAMFLHGSVVHILLNMWALAVLGPYLERRLGRGKFLAVYLISGLAGSVAVLLLVAPLVPTIGASTAIYGLFGAISIDRLHSGGLGDPFLRNMAIILVINLVFSFTISGISWQGHIGGLIGGVACMEALARFGKKDPGRRLEGGDVLALVAVVVVLVGLVIYRAANFGA